jgi:radical SAM protein (TIGR01212 family)
LSSETAQQSLTASPPDWRDSGFRYYKYSHFLARRFGGRIYRVSVDGGFTCPNVDGTVAVGGCVYCDNRSFSPSRRGPRTPIGKQIDLGLVVLDGKFEPDGYLAYFQAATNTYAPLDKLRRLYDEALSHPRVMGLIVGTRPDCVPDDVLDLLQSYAREKFVSIEFGLQSIHQRSLDWMNRGHDVACFFDAVARSQGRGLDVCAHVILGLPGESADDQMATADALAQTKVDGVKIHNLHVVEGTPLEEQFRRGEVRILDQDEYVELLIDFLERLPATMVVHRVTGDAPTEYLVAPRWVHRKAEFLHLLDRRMAARDAYQGRLFRSRTDLPS